ncbi:MAG TPA: SulP family inorganic anion transporter [Pirellulaceae bacterium]|nr:SulP family inorganic anion transporter [Pirellulaceae bacterium]
MPIIGKATFQEVRFAAIESMRGRDYSPTATRAKRIAKHAAMIPVSVVEGMLASIGMLIIVKQLPMFFGYTGKVHAHEFYQFVMEAPSFALGMNSPVFAVSVCSLVVLFALGSLKRVKWLAIVPPQLLAVIFGAILGRVFALKDLGPGYLISLPADAFHGFKLPDFAGLFANGNLWYAAGLAVVTLTMIDGVESLATAMAIDRLDPYHRKSEPNRLLLAMGVCNIASSLVGGLTIIPGGVKSKANIASGGRTLWANFTNAICLILYLWIGREIINTIPKGVLAAVLIYTGWKMCEPLVWKHIAHIGKTQLFIFAFTIVCTLATDLLLGIVAGTIAKFVVNVVLYRRALSTAADAETDSSILSMMKSFFSSPVARREVIGTEYHVYVERPLVCFNLAKFGQEFDILPEGTTEVFIHLERHVGLIDHTSFENVDHVTRDLSHRGIPVTLVGLERMRRMSEYHASMHVLAPARATPIAPQPA